MTVEKKEIAKLKLHAVKPTNLNLKLLRNWVVWQFPKTTAKVKGFYGAVHPPLEKHGWFPAIINPDKNEVQVYGHLTETFATPELAADYFATDGKL